MQAHYVVLKRLFKLIIFKHVMYVIIFVNSKKTQCLDNDFTLQKSCFTFQELANDLPASWMIKNDGLENISPFKHGYFG